MTQPYRGNDDRRLSGDGSVDERAEHEAEEHAEVLRREDPDAIADEDDGDESRDEAAGTVQEPPD